MSKHKWFFKRGNARLSWENVPDWAVAAAIDLNGQGYWFHLEPKTIDNNWFSDGQCRRACYVGKQCPDWQSLVFKRPAEEFSGLDFLLSLDCPVTFEVRKPCKPVLPTITAEEWAAIRMLLPGAEYVMKSRNYGYVNASNMQPVLYEWSGDWSVPAEGELIRVPILDRRFDHVPWRESLVKYEAAS